MYCYATQSRRCARAKARNCGFCMCVCVCVDLLKRSKTCTMSSTYILWISSLLWLYNFSIFLLKKKNLLFDAIILLFTSMTSKIFIDVIFSISPKAGGLELICLSSPTKLWQVSGRVV